MSRAYSQNKRKDFFRNLKGKFTGKRPLGRPWGRWDDNIRMDPKQIGVDAVKLLDHRSTNTNYSKQGLWKQYVSWSPILT